MTPIIDTTATANLRGSIWMIAAMAAFALEDALLKMASQTMPIGQILIIFGLGGASVFAIAARTNNQPLFVPDVLSLPMRIRVLFEVIGRLFYVLAISLIPLSAATVILQATPLVVVAGAALIFGEKVGWRRWTAIAVGMLGVLVVIQPGAESFSLLSLLAVVGMIGFAGRDLASRAAPVSLGTAVLGLYGFLAIVVAGALYAVWQRVPFSMPDTSTTFTLLAAIFAGCAAYACLMRAMRTGEVSAVTPLRYTRLLFGIFLGVAVFGEQVSIAMIAGSALIVASGVFILSRGPA